MAGGERTRIGGRTAQVNSGGSANSPGTCLVNLLQRSYPESSGEPRVELLQVTVSLGAQQSSDAACRSATALVEDAVPKLPPT